MIKVTRRNFLNTGLKALSIGTALLSGVVGGVLLKSGRKVQAATESDAWTTKWQNHAWNFVVDTTKCIGCGKCVQACKTENDVPYDAEVYRTWVERYRIERYRIGTDEKVLVDSPQGGINNFPKEPGDSKYTKAFFVPKLCNHCFKPPCVQVCPVGATYSTKEGVVLVDRGQCIGCGYCIQGCPYGVRFMHPKLNVVDKCTWCYHRITKGMKPACVLVCPTGARLLDDVKAPNNQISKILEKERVGVLKQAMGTEPQVFYVGMDKVVN